MFAHHGLTLEPSARNLTVKIVAFVPPPANALTDENANIITDEKGNILTP
jgi:hypothetical protein